MKALLVILAGIMTMWASPLPAAGEKLAVSFANETRLEVQRVTLKGAGEGGHGFVDSVVRVAPGNTCDVSFDVPSTLTGVSLDMGVARFDFEDVAALAGYSVLRLQIKLDERDTPLLQGQGQEQGQGKNDVAAPGMEFTREAGPIWSNDHAQKRCPEVLGEWLRDNPGRTADWTGHWWTTRQGKMSVCVLKAGPAAEPPVQQASRETPGDAELRIPGRLTLLLAENETGGADLADLVKASTMAEVRALARSNPAEGGDEDDDRVLSLKARFGGSTWLAFVQPDRDSYDPMTGYDENKVRPGRIAMRAYARGQAREGALSALRGMGWRPWHLQVESGPDMDLARRCDYPVTVPDAQKAWETLVREYKWPDPRPNAVKSLLLPASGYEEAVAGRRGPTPGILFQAGNSVVMTLEYVPDASACVATAR